MPSRNKENMEDPYSFGGYFILRGIERVIISQETLKTNGILKLEKKQIIQQTQLLDFCLTDKKLSDLGGLNIFKKWQSGWGRLPGRRPRDPVPLIRRSHKHVGILS